MTAQKKLKSVKTKSQSKAKKPPRPPKPIEVQKPMAKIHPFAVFMKDKGSYKPSSSAQMHKLSNHDTYRKKAI